jgi:hypothetical protein
MEEIIKEEEKNKMEETTYLDAIGRKISPEALEGFIQSDEGRFEETGENEYTFVPTGYYVRYGCLPEPYGC